MNQWLKNRDSSNLVLELNQRFFPHLEHWHSGPERGSISFCQHLWTQLHDRMTNLKTLKNNCIPETSSATPKSTNFHNSLDVSATQSAGFPLIAQLIEKFWYKQMTCQLVEVKNHCNR